MTAVLKKKRTTIYSIYCFVVLFVGTICRMVKRIGNGKCGKVGQAVLSLLAFLCLAGTVLFCAAWESESSSSLSAIFGAGACLLGFGVFSEMAGAFRPYRYMKRKQSRINKGKVVRIPTEAMSYRKKSA